LVLESKDYTLLIKDNSLASNFESEGEFEGSRDDSEFLNGNLTETITDVERNVVVKNNNDAFLRNNLNLNADTGHNEANRLNAEITTGNALIETDIFNMLNTNITGKNWYFGVINIFDTFTGDIIFPRADVAVNIDSDKNEVKSNDTFTYRIQYTNVGQLTAENTSLVAVFPSDTKIISTTKQGTKSGQTMSWSLGTLDKDAHDTIYVQVQVNPSNDSHMLVATSVIHTSSKEVETENNSAQTTVTFKSGATFAAASAQKNESSSNQSTSTSTPSTQPTVTPTVQLTNAQKNPYSLTHIAGISSSDDKLGDQPDTKQAVKTQKSNGKISIDGLFKTSTSWGPLAIAYFLGVASTLLALRIKRLFLG
jgi:uncharacterized repeat protein (TIGR01451 family)